MTKKLPRLIALLVAFIFSFEQLTLAFEIPLGPFESGSSLKSDPAFELPATNLGGSATTSGGKELSSSDLDKIKSRLESLIEEDIHFGQSAVHALYEMLVRSLSPSQLETLNLKLETLTSLALFSDILAGVISPEFIGNLQFSAYTLKQIAQSYGLRLTGLRLTFDELKAIVDAGYPVLVSIEDRHFVVVTEVSSCKSQVSSCEETVTFLENGYTRTKTASEFTARWFGTALVTDSALPGLNLKPETLNLKLLTTRELLRVKGAGWFKKLFKKIAKFFQNEENGVSS